MAGMELKPMGFFERLGTQARIDRPELIGRICSGLDIPDTPANREKVETMVVPAIDLPSGRIKGNYAVLLSSSLISSLNVTNKTPEAVRESMIRSGIVIEWDREKAVEDLAELLQALTSVKDLRQSLNILKKSLAKFNLCTGYAIFMRDQASKDKALELIDSSNMVDRGKKPRGGVAQIELRARQIQNIIHTTKDPVKRAEYKEKAIFYGVWHVTDRTYWLEYGMDQSVLDKFRSELLARLDRLESTLTGEPDYIEECRNVINAERTRLLSQASDIEQLTKAAIQKMMKLSDKSKHSDIRARFGRFEADLQIAVRESLDEAYKVAEANIKTWSEADPKAKRYLNLNIKESFLIRSNFESVVNNFSEAAEDLAADIKRDPKKGELCKESLIMCIYDDNFNVVAVIAGNNFEKNLRAGHVNPIFRTLEEKQGRIRLYEKIIIGLSNTFFREQHKMTLTSANEQLQNDKRDLQLTMRLSSMVNNESLPLQVRLEKSCSEVANICSKGRAKVGVSMMLVDMDDPGILRVAATYGKPASLIGTAQNIGVGIAGKVAKTKRPMFHKDISVLMNNPALYGTDVISPMERKYSSKSFMSIPMMVGDKLIGVMNIDGSEMMGNELEIMQMVAGINASAVNNTWLSITDGLTGLFVRRKLNLDLPALVASTHTEGSDLSILMIDLDNFKMINDRFGHLVGDEVLKSVSAMERKTLKGRGYAYRYGGEELVVILPRISKAEATNIATEINKRIAEMIIGKNKVRCTVSIGVSSFKEDYNEKAPNPADDLLDKADAAENVQKRKWNKNGVTVHCDSVAAEWEQIKSEDKARKAEEERRRSGQ